MSIISLSGKIRSGKSTVANIIQLLIGRDKLQHEHPNTIFENMLNPNYINSYSKEELEGMSNWKQVAFAAKLKQIVALLIGCTVEQLEDQVFKSSPLGKEWERWYYKFYKLTTNTHDGKVSPYFNTEEEAKLYEFPKFKFNTPMFNKEYLQLVREELTPRLLLQLVGTEGLRNLIHPNAHVNGLFADYIGHCNSQFCLGTKQCPDEHLTKDCNAIYPNWIITDCRFPNEVKAIKERNGIVIRVNRRIYKNTIPNSEVINSPRPLDLGSSYNYDKEQDVWYDELIEQSTHESETSLDDFNDFDYIVNNDSTIEDLIKQVKRILEAEFII